MSFLNVLHSNISCRRVHFQIFFKFSLRFVLLIFDLLSKLHFKSWSWETRLIFTSFKDKKLYYFFYSKSYFIMFIFRNCLYYKILSFPNVELCHMSAVRGNSAPRWNLGRRCLDFERRYILHIDLFLDVYTAVTIWHNICIISSITAPFISAETTFLEAY